MQKSKEDIESELKIVRALKAVKATINTLDDKIIDETENRLTSEFLEYTSGRSSG